MDNFRFRPTLWPTVFTVAALILLISLGNWQLRRLHWKEGLIAARATALAAPEAAVPRTLADAKPLEFHHVFAEGRFLNDRELYVHSSDLQGDDGYQIVTPLVLDDGAILLVNRGFVPESRKEPSSRKQGQLEGRQHIDGILRLSVHPRGWLVPENRPDDNFWLYVDVPGMAQASHLDAAKVLPFYIEAGPHKNPGGLPAGAQTDASLPNDHLQYAVTWYGFAATLVVVYLIYHLRRTPGEGRS